MVGGAADYLSDLIKIFNQHDWHWAFFTFRQDFWDGMDYEIGTKPPAGLIGNQSNVEKLPPRRKDNA